MRIDWNFLYSVFFISLLLPCSEAAAHPVNFKEAIAVMPGYSVNRNEIEVNYTFDTKEAFALNFIDTDLKKGNAKFYLPQYNYKLYRKNELESQTNVYGMLGAGVADHIDESMFAGRAALQADYETRRIYTLFGAERLQSEEGVGLTSLRYRLGFAPYLADFSGFHTWLIAQVDYTPEMHNEWTASPLLRFFYDTYLLETGFTHRGDFMVSAILHF